MKFINHHERIESNNVFYNPFLFIGKPDPPDKPTVEYIGDDVMVRWNEPRNNGGCPIIGTQNKKAFHDFLVPLSGVITLKFILRIRSSVQPC